MFFIYGFDSLVLEFCCLLFLIKKNFWAIVIDLLGFGFIIRFKILLFILVNIKIYLDYFW